MDDSGTSQNACRPDGSEVVPPPRSKRLKIDQAQAEVDEVVDIMQTNVKKVIERDSKLSELNDRAEALSMGASQFESHAGKLKKKMFWKNMKMMIILGSIGAVVLVIIIYAIFSK